jgi:putative OPT family oligopeptide transporter
MARTVGSIGESVAAGAIFTIPAFFIAGIWKPFLTTGNYITASLILIFGAILGIMFVALLRRVMVEDANLPYPESVAASEIHKTGRKSGSGGSKFLFGAMGMGAIIKALGAFKVFPEVVEKFIFFAKQTITGTKFVGQGGVVLSSPGISPAYMGVGYIIGPKLAALNFSGGMIAWGLLTPIILYFIAPNIDFGAIATAIMKENSQLTQDQAYSKAWIDTAFQVWKYIVRPIAIGGMLVGASFTLYKMRKSLFTGIARSVNDVKKAAKGESVTTARTDKDLSFYTVIGGILVVAIATFCITFFIFHAAFHVALVAATVLIILAFFFAAVSGYLVGIMGSSNNPISGLTLTALVVTALIMVIMGVTGQEGVATVLGVAAIVCVAAAVAGEMLQDLKVGHILGGTPWKMQFGDILGVVLAGSVMFLVLSFLNDGDIAMGIREGYSGGFGSPKLSAPQASLMAILSQGIVGGQMAWPLIIVGMLMGIGLILMQVSSPMLVSVGMYLPLETTFAIFLGGVVKGIVDMFNKRRNHNDNQKARIENAGVLLASGLIAGEALMGLVFAGFAVFDIFPPSLIPNSPFIISVVVLCLIAWVLVQLPLKKAGDPNESGGPSMNG